MRGVIDIVIGLVVLFGGGALGIAWIVFCFGTVIVGLLLLFLAPWVLFSPLTLCIAFGGAMIRNGWGQASG
jgi:hypothetical protein